MELPLKHPELFDLFIDKLKQRGLNFTAVRTIEETSSRDEYFSLLGKSKIMLSFADQETFGYSTLESMALDNIVIVPNRLSYVETVPSQYRYDTLDEAFTLLINSLTNYKKPEYDDCYLVWKNSISTMLDLL